MMSEERQIGIYSGTFDPIHLGHIAFALQAMRDCGLDMVIFLPEPRPRNKQGVTKLSHRLELINLAIEDEPNLSVLRLTSPQFTVRGTLPKLQQEFGDAHLTFLMGSDVAKSLGYWKSIKTLLRCASLAIGLRENDNPDEIAASMEQLGQEQGIPVDYTLISTAKADVSSSKVRGESGGLSLLPPSVLAYIQKHGLYMDALHQVAEES